MMLAPSLVVVLCLVNFVHSRSFKVSEDDCIIPNTKKQGICINLQECPSIYAMANNYTAKWTVEKFRFLIESQCGFNGINPKVCCSKSETFKHYKKILDVR